jgi:hypothetical protein
MNNKKRNKNSKKLQKMFFKYNLNYRKKTVCNCESIETTDIRLDKNGKYYHILCNKPITNKRWG